MQTVQTENIRSASFFTYTVFFRHHFSTRSFLFIWQAVKLHTPGSKQAGSICGFWHRSCRWGCENLAGHHTYCLPRSASTNAIELGLKTQNELIKTCIFWDYRIFILDCGIKKKFFLGQSSLDKDQCHSSYSASDYWWHSLTLLPIWWHGRHFHFWAEEEVGWLYYCKVDLGLCLSTAIYFLHFWGAVNFILDILPLTSIW